MSNLRFSVHGILTKHSTESKNGIIFKRMNIKCQDTSEIQDIMEELRGWAKLSDGLTNLAVIRNVDDDPYGLRVIPFNEYDICLNMTICGETIPVQFKTMKVAIKAKKMKDENGQRYIKKVLEANLTLEKAQLDDDNKIDASFLKYSECDPETGKEFLVPLEMNFEQIPSFSIFGETESEGSDSDEIQPVDAVIH